MKKMKLLLIGLMLLGSSSVYACGMGEVTVAGYENASIAHAYKHWKQGKHTKIPFVFIDVRTPQEFKAGHIPGAVNMPVSSITEHLNEIPKDKQIYVYCHSGKRAARASTVLAKAGFSVENIPESMVGWEAAGYPIEK
ncbi:MAG: rhodanese-like domain-containing protein [Ghiorsea sp.]|nr:rhodanese-like domain-containing protein [Ghiorsea sp.]